MNGWMNGLSEAVKQRLLEEGVEKAEDIAGLSVVDLRELFQMNTKDIIHMRKLGEGKTKPKKRPRDSHGSEDNESNDEESSDGEAKNHQSELLEGMIEDPLGVRNFLPSRWAEHDDVSWRTIIPCTALGRCENLHVKQEADFLIKLIPTLIGGKNQKHWYGHVSSK